MPNEECLIKDVEYRMFKSRDLLSADECFITNSGVGIMPVVRVNGKKIGSGKPGPITKKLLEVFKDVTMKL